MTILFLSILVSIGDVRPILETYEITLCYIPLESLFGKQKREALL